MTAGRSAVEALGILEKGRDVIRRMMDQEPTDLLITKTYDSELDEESHSLIRQHESLIQEYNRDVANDEISSMPQLTSRRHEVAAALSTLEERIRQIPGFEDFRREPSIKTLL